MARRQPGFCDIFHKKSGFILFLRGCAGAKLFQEPARMNVRFSILNLRGLDSGLHRIGQRHRSTRSEDDDAGTIVFRISFDTCQTNKEQSTLLERKRDDIVRSAVLQLHTAIEDILNSWITCRVLGVRPEERSRRRSTQKIWSTPPCAPAGWVATFNVACGYLASESAEVG